jgi:hypothetical protein
MLLSRAESQHALREIRIGPQPPYHDASPVVWVAMVGKIFLC